MTQERWPTPNEVQKSGSSPLDEVLAMTIALLAVAGAQPPWPPGLQGGAFDLFKRAGENPPPWLRLRDFTPNGEACPPSPRSIARPRALTPEVIPNDPLPFRDPRHCELH
jgi:hypothetical protein